MVNYAAADPSDPAHGGLVPAGVLVRAIHAADAPICLTDDVDGRRSVVWVNDAFTRLTGLALDAIRGQAPGVLAHPDGAGAASELHAAGIATGRVVTADGGSAVVRIAVSPVRDVEAKVTHWVYVLTVQDPVEHAPVVEHASADDRGRIGLGVLAQISAILHELDDVRVLDDVAGALRGRLVSWAGLYLDDRRLRLTDALADALDDGSAGGPASAASARSGPAGSPSPHPRPPDVDAVALVLAGVRAEVDLDVRITYPTTSASAWVAACVRDADGPSAPVVVLPIPGRGRILGVLVVVPLGGGGAATLDASSLTVLELAARRVGMAVDNARLYAREHRIAESLQRAMLPEQPDVAGLDVWTHYSPNTGHAQIGGDWYDVLPLDTDVIGIVIGDVVGHDVEATAAMGQLRSVMRSSANEVLEPGRALERVDDLVAGMRIPRAAGLVFTTLHRRGDEWHAAYSRAGHLPALHVRGGVVTQLDGAGGALIGFGGPERTTAHLILQPGDVLVHYTDGLIERRDRALHVGVAELAAVAAEITAVDAAGIGEELLARLTDQLEDDVALVVVRVPDPADGVVRPSSIRTRRWRLPNEPASVARARHAVLRTCRTWDLPVATAASAELVVSELVANAVLHGWGYVSLRLVDTDEGLRIEVEDANAAPPVPTDGHATRVGGFGMQIVDRLADWGWKPTAAGKQVWAVVRPDRVSER